jgi:radical SAM superfamily enzyme YgiQ (UPF0313 family)
MNTIICAINSKYIHSSLAPWYLLAGVETYGAEGITAEVVEGTVNEDLETVAARIIKKRPDIIGVGCYIWNIAFIKKLLPAIKKALPEAFVILGGPEVSYNAGDVLREETLVDYIISGEGELPFALLINALAYGASLRGIPGLCYKRNGEIVVSAPHCPQNMPPDPYTHAYFKALGGRIAYLETSRGCPFQCAFCLSGNEGRARYFNLDKAKRDILSLAVSGTQTIKFVDRTFNVDRSRASEIWKFILENHGSAIPKNVRFHFEIAGDLLDEATLKLLSTAPKGLFQFEIGLQSFNPESLEAVRRKTDMALVKKNIERLLSFGNIHIHIDLIAGLPYEDMKSFADGFNIAFAVKPHMLQLGFLKLLHGAAMRTRPEAYPCRYSTDPPYEIRSTPWLTDVELERLHAVEDALDRLYNSGRFRRTLDYLLLRTAMTPLNLFAAAGAFLDRENCHHISLDAFTTLILELFGALPGVDWAALHDAMVCDWLATVAGGRLPASLRLPDARWKQVIRACGAALPCSLLKTPLCLPIIRTETP